MNKTEFIHRIAEHNDLTVKSAGEVTDMVLKEIIAVMTEHDKVYFQELGTFGAEFKPAHDSRNPATGEKIVVPDKYVPTFKFTGTIKEAVKASK